MPLKMLELVSTLVPRGARVAVLVDRYTPFLRRENRREVERTAKSLHLRAEFIELTAAAEFPGVFAALEKNPPAAVVVLPGSMFFALAVDMVKRVEPLKVPAIYPFENMVEAGGLMSYAAPIAESYHRAAYYVDRILRGAKPGDLPIEQPTRLALAINLRTARALGLKIPQSVLVRADRVIE